MEQDQQQQQQKSFGGLFSISKMIDLDRRSAENASCESSEIDMEPNNGSGNNKKAMLKSSDFEDDFVEHEEEDLEGEEEGCESNGSFSCANNVKRGLSDNESDFDPVECGVAVVADAGKRCFKKFKKSPGSEWHTDRDG